jgi:AbrB family looped-hinge helix DNA binding protein
MKAVDYVMLQWQARWAASDVTCLAAPQTHREVGRREREGQQQKRPAMTVVKVLARGRITVPPEVLEAANLKPGDALHVTVVGPGELRIKVLPRLGPRELRERYPIETPIHEDADREAWQKAASEDAAGGSGE